MLKENTQEEKLGNDPFVVVVSVTLVLVLSPDITGVDIPPIACEGSAVLPAGDYNNKHM
jgi:hypothetical protein